MGVLPFLRWAGSKRQLLPTLAAYWKPSFNRYIEPFAGSARLFFHICPQQAILGDINSELIHTYRQLIAAPHCVINATSRWCGDEKTYYRVRALRPDRLSHPTRAARFIYLNRYCFNGLYRTNLNGDFNVPYGGLKSGQISGRHILKACSTALRRAKLIAGDFEKVLELAETGDFVYMDPPFSTTSRRVFVEYDKAGFNSADITRLRASLNKLARRRVAFLVSYADSPEADYLSEGFDRKFVSVKRSIAGFAGARAATNEVLISHRI
jgi:DNA adenine methylase